MDRARLQALPQIITLAGAFCGMLSMSLAGYDTYGAGVAIVAAATCDMLDGRVARWTGTTSAFGAQLDSLADILSFGLAPAFLAWHAALKGPGPGWDPWLLMAFAYVACAAWRLARFNVRAPTDGRPTTTFEGIPSPVGALLPTSQLMVADELGLPALATRPAVAFTVCACAVLMVSSMAFPAYKHFHSQLARVAFYGTVALGLTLLAVRQPGGVVLFAVLAGYVCIGVARAGLRATGVASR